MSGKEKIAKLGKPSMIFGLGQQRRLDLIKKYADLKGKRILDIGCGIGMYSQKFKGEGAEVFGIDIDKKNIERAKKLDSLVNFLCSSAEKTPFEDNFFDIVFLNEVLEHVKDDKKALKEALRVVRPRGKIIIFAPNRLFPFETHGIYLFNRYIYRNFPFVNWLPGALRNYFCPHVRVYFSGALKKLLEGSKADFVLIDYIWPGFDKIKSRHRALAKIFIGMRSFAEKNKALKKFGISIFAIIQKT